MSLEVRGGWAQIARRPSSRSDAVQQGDGETGWIVEWEVPDQSIKIRVPLGRTVCLGGYEFARVTIGFTARVARREQMDEAYAYMRDVVAEVLDRELAGIKDQARTKVPIEDPPVRLYCMEFEVEYGLTLAQENKGYGKADVAVTQPIGDHDSIESSVQLIQEWIEARIAEETARIRQGVRAGADLGL